MSRVELQEVLADVMRFAETADELGAVQDFVVAAIAGKLPGYDWVGFYMLDPEDPTVLVLGSFVGEPTEHVRIPVTQGICGAAVALGETVVVDDVTLDPRYLSCSMRARSEIVVPIRVCGEVVGEIDIDSHKLSAFETDDRKFLEECTRVVGEFMERARSRSRSL